MISVDGTTDLKLGVVALPLSDVDSARSVYTVSEQSREKALS